MEERLEKKRLEHELEMEKLVLKVLEGSNPSVSGSSSNFKVLGYCLRGHEDERNNIVGL